MSNLRYLFNSVLDFAKSYGLPTEKKRGILREYYQVRLLQKIYAQELSKNLSFIGGTAVRFLRGINRFSEDLDFDTLNGITNRQIKEVVTCVEQEFEQEDESVDVKVAEKGDKFCFEFMFPNILFDLGLTGQKREVLMIKLDYFRNWKNQQTETVLMNEYGFLSTVVTNGINQLLVQKLTAYVCRSLTQTRDIYDVVWLFAQGARLDKDFMHANNLDDLLPRAKEKLSKEGIARGWGDKLRPFLFNSADVQKLDMFGEILNRLG